jgi:hypothetical protein
MSTDGSITIDDIFDMYAQLTAVPNVVPGCMFTSIDQLQEWRPDLTDEVLAKAGFVRGVHLVAIADGKIMPVTPEECP